ncbi:glycosyltransferase family 2 protein [Thermodesulfovibrio sp. Kuro-1]|uniref:glycosyltransferase family 2 protein n=1 Tax=Thermodesulfovibrio sp. Kuro-1 TaxID=2580394 RepID=UPI001C6403B7|nr:glycosyltransferase family 2 protein [Thermodesulfovibrio sp. Kuro-1]
MSLKTKEKSLIINHPEDKFETLLFLPPTESRKGEGGLRTKGYFKHNYKLNPEDNLWYICDTAGDLVKPAPEEIQREIVDFIASMKSSEPEMANISDITELPLITVITVVLNGEKYLEQTIQSVINQTYPNVEYIIIDGGSTDGTLDIIKKYEDYIDYWVSEKDRGIYDAMNKGVKVALGSWIGFLGSGDFYFSSALVDYVMSDINSELKDCEYLSSRIGLMKNNKIVRIIGQEWNWRVFKKYMNVAHVGSLHSINLFKKYGLFDNSFKIAGDYEFLLRPKSELKARYIDKITATMNIEGISNRNIKVFYETELAKIIHTGRNKLPIKLEKYLVILKWLIRKAIIY